MKLVKTVIELDVYGTKIELRKPNFKESQHYREEILKLGENGEAASVMADFLEKMGLPKEVFESLEFGHITEIMEAITTSKKN